MSIQDIHQELSRRVAAAIQAYEDGYEAEQAEYNNELPDFRKRNAALDAAQARLFFVPFATQKEVYFHYDDVFASIPWRSLVPVVVFKETPKLLMVGWDSDLDRLQYRSHAKIADPGDSIDLDDLHIDPSPAFAFKQISKTELGRRIFRTAQEAFDALPAAHKLPRAEMERRVAEARKECAALLAGEDEARRAQPCAHCRQPIGQRAYVHYLGGLTHDKALQYIHLDCRKCASCGETITGEYCEVDMKQDTEPQTIGPGMRSYSGPRYLGKTYYHAACAYQEGVRPTNGGARHPQYGFYTHRAEHDIRQGWGDLVDLL